MNYYLAASLVEFRDEINGRWPHRDTASDGWIGDASHAAGYSSHNPLWTTQPPGCVRAIDVDSDGPPGAKTDLVAAVLNVAIGDPRCWYVIWNRKIYSRTYGWAAHAYTGSNPHDHHVHISLVESEHAYDDTTAWFGRTKTRGPLVDLFQVRARFDDGRANAGVRRIQRSLNDRYGLGLDVDGVAGTATHEAWRLHERKMGVKAPNDVPHLHSLRTLGRGRFAVRR